MQAAMQINSPFFANDGYMNAQFGSGAQSQPSRASGFNNGGSQLSQMANMLSNFSKASFSVFSQNTSQGNSSTFMAQGTLTGRDPAGSLRGAYPQPGSSQAAAWNRQNNPNTSCFGNNRSNGSDNYGRSYRDNNRDNSRGIDGRRADACDGRTAPDRCASKDSHSQTPPPSRDCGCKNAGSADQTQWSNTEVSGNKASIDLGDYKLNFDKADSSMSMTNTKTGDTTKVWGDPHIDQHANSSSKTSAMFNGPMTFQLPDNTKVTVGTQPGTNNKSVSYADQVTITHGNQAYQVTGLSQQNSAGLSVQKSHDGQALDAAAPDGYTLQANADGSGWIDPTTGKQPTANDFRKATA